MDKTVFQCQKTNEFKFSDYLGLILAFILGSSVKACNQPDVLNKLDLFPGFALSVIMTLISLSAFDYFPIIIRIFGYTIGKIIYCFDNKKAYKNSVVLYGTEILTVLVWHVITINAHTM